MLMYIIEDVCHPPRPQDGSSEETALDVLD